MVFTYLNLALQKMKYLDELQKAKDHAEENDRLKTAFLQNISHEIRSPMNGILGFANLLLEPGLTGEDQHKYIEIIKSSGDRMLNTINDLMDISLIESNQMKVNVSDVYINEQIKYLYTFFKPEAEKKRIQLSYKNQLPDQEVKIKTDAEKIYAILTNLIKNAINYTNDGSIEFGYIKKTDREPAELEFFVKVSRQTLACQKNMRAQDWAYLFQKLTLRCLAAKYGWSRKRVKVRYFILQFHAIKPK
ncbi:MAG: hypothetical protein B6D61_06720 [Bacteroidetes bacterium 4484_249]|nr:MAG: hypothetical protein B6D61_06720 [Bacteroidetes bacterium 4484_249]